MLKQYFKQALQLIKQNKLFSAIYVVGTALGISMVMIIAIFFFLKTGSIYPELERNNLLFVKSAQMTPKDTTDASQSSSLLSLQTVKSCFYNLKSPEAVTATLFTYEETNKIHALGENVSKSVYVKYTDFNFWKVYQFRFLQGKPFSQEDFASAIPSAVVTESLSNFLFPDGQAAGKRFVMNDQEYRISGVVKDPSYLLTESFAHIWLPYTLHEEHKETFGEDDILGNLSVTILLKNKHDAQRVRDEINDNIQRYSANLTQNINLLGQPDNALASSFRLGNRPLNLNNILLKFFVILLIFLLVPAINLSGLNSGRMEKRMVEMGVRKAFGAPNRTLLSQILIENFLLTLIGAVIGLLISYLLVSVFSELFIAEFALLASEKQVITSTSSGITPAILINFTVFFWALLAALVINILSAIIPALRFTRKTITDSLNENYSY